MAPQSRGLFLFKSFCLKFKKNVTTVPLYISVSNALGSRLV
jgi:hypothetical protein